MVPDITAFVLKKFRSFAFLQGFFFKVFEGKNQHNVFYQLRTLRLFAIDGKF